MRRILVAIGVACMLSSGLVYAQLGASDETPPQAYQQRVMIHLFSPWLGEQDIEMIVPSETDARVKVEELLSRGYWEFAIGAQRPTVVWPPSSIAWIKIQQVF